jgi:hypothetical protein
MDYEKKVWKELRLMNDLACLELYLSGVRQEKLDKIVKKNRG